MQNISFSVTFFHIHILLKTHWWKIFNTKSNIWGSKLTITLLHMSTKKLFSNNLTTINFSGNFRIVNYLHQRVIISTQNNRQVSVQMKSMNRFNASVYRTPCLFRRAKQNILFISFVVVLLWYRSKLRIIRACFAYF